MTTIEATFKDSSKQPIQGTLQAIPENSDAILSEDSTIFISKQTAPIPLLFGSATFDLIPGQYIFSLNDVTGRNSTSFSASIPDLSATISLSDYVSTRFGSTGAIASTSEPGVIIVGQGLSIDQNGVLSVSELEINSTIASRLGTLTDAIIFVNAKAPPGNDAFTNNGQSQFSPFRSIERALVQAALSTDPVTIMVSPGNYLVDNSPGLSTSATTALASDPVNYPLLTGIPADYNRYQDAANLIWLNLQWITQQAYLAVQGQMAQDLVTLTTEQTKLCKRDLGLIVKGLINDVAEMGNKWTLCSARTYKNPAQQLTYLTTGQINSMLAGLESIRVNAISAVINKAPTTDSTVPSDFTTGIVANSCSDVQATINTLISIIKTTLNSNTNPWSIPITRGIFPNLNLFNPPKVVLDSNNNEFSQAIYQNYRDAATLIQNNRTALLADAYAVISSSVLSGNVVKCQRDFGYILDAICADIRTLSNKSIISVAKYYKDINGNLLLDSNANPILTTPEITLMVSALANLQTNINLAITNNFGDPTVFTPSPGNYSGIQAFANTLILILTNTLTGSSYNPWTTTVQKGVTVLSGGIVVPNGATFIASGLRQPVIQPMYIAQEDLDHETEAPIFKLTSNSFTYGFTYFDTPGANSTHHKLTVAMFASDNFELNPASSAYYWSKVGTIFYSNIGYFSTEDTLDTDSETVIGAPTEPGDNDLVDSIKSASPYVYNCSVRSVYGMNGLLADGNQVAGFRSMVTAQFTQVSLQRDKNAWQKWDAASEGWLPLGEYDDFTTMKPALYIDYVQGISSANLQPIDQSIRLNPRYRHTGFKGKNNAFVQIVSCFGIGLSQSYSVESGSDFSITNSNTNFGEIALVANGFKNYAFLPDSNFNFTAIIPPLPLTSSSIVEYVFSQFNAALTLAYHTSSGLRDRIYLVGGVSLPEVFTLLVGGKAYLYSAGTEYPLDLTEVPSSNNLSYAVDGSGNWYIQVNPATNTVFTSSSTTNQVDLLDGARLYIKRVVDERTTEQKVYQFVIQAPDATKRIPPAGYIFNTGNQALTNANKIFWVYESNVYGNPSNNEYALVLLGLSADGTSQQASSLVPLQQSDYNVEPVIDNITGQIDTPNFNPATSLTYQIANLIFNTPNLGYTPALVNWLTPSYSAVQVTNLGIGGFPATVQTQRPSEIRCNGHLFEYVGYPQYSQGFPQFQQIVIPSSYQLFKNRKNINGGIVYYSGMDDKGNLWSGDTLTNLATGASTNLTVVDVPAPPTPATFDTLDVTTSIVVGGELEIDPGAITIPANGFLRIGNVRQFIATAAPTSGVYNVGDIVLNSNPVLGAPYAWRCVSAVSPLTFEPIAGWIIYNQTVTNAFTIPSGATATIVGSLSTTGSTNLAGTVVIDPTVGSSTLDNVTIGSVTPKPATATTLTSTGLTTANSLTVTNGETVGGTLNVTGATSLTSLAVSTNQTVAGTLAVAGNSTLASVSVTNNETVGGTLGVTGNSTFSNVSVTGNETVGGTLGVTGATTLNSLAVTNGETVGGNLAVTGSASVGGTFGVTGQATINLLQTSGASFANGVVYMAGGGTYSFFLNPTGTSTSSIDNVIIGGTTPLAITGTTITSTGASTLNSLAVTNNGTVGGTLGVTGATTFNSNLTASGTTASVTVHPATVSIAPTGTTSTVDNVTIGATTPRPLTATTIGSTGLATLSSGSITGNLTVGGTLGVTGATTFSSLSVTGNETIGGTLGVTGASTLNSLAVTNNGTVGGTLGVTGTTTFNSNLTASGSAAVVTIHPLTYSLAPTGTTSTVDNVVIGSTTPRPINATTLNTTGAATLASASVTGTLGVTGATTLTTLNTTGLITAEGLTVSDYIYCYGVGSIILQTNDTGSKMDGVILGSVTPRAITGTTINSTGAATLASLSVTGNETITGTLGVTGATTVANLTATGDVHVPGAEFNQGVVYMAGGATYSFYLAPTLSTSSIDNVIIGGTTPAQITGTTIGATVKFNESLHTLTYAASLNIDLSTSNIFKLLLTGNITSLTVTNISAGRYDFLIVQNTSGSGNTITGYSSAFKFPGGTKPTLTAAANAVDKISCISDGTNLYCSFTANYS